VSKAGIAPQQCNCLNRISNRICCTNKLSCAQATHVYTPEERNSSVRVTFAWYWQQPHRSLQVENSNSTLQKPNVWTETRLCVKTCHSEV